MGKVKTVFICQECGYETAKWLGKCPECNTWNSLIEEYEKKELKSANNKIISVPKRLADVKIIEEDRIKSGISELDRVLGGGIVEGSLVLVGGDPGIGKSTLMLQLCDKLDKDTKILYISGEESIKQIKIRADRLKVDKTNIYIISETDIDIVLGSIDSIKPDIVILDSIQTIYNSELTSAPGSVSQVREITHTMMKTAKEKGVSVFVIGHVTKEGSIAGPRVLEHMVDCVLYFEGERHQSYRILRAVKNRFGSTNEIGVFEMTDKGLNEILNPSHLFLEGRPKQASGSCVISIMEGTRPLLAELQALVSPTLFGMPRRMAAGVDYNRVNLLIAVLEKRYGLNLQSSDAYVNIAGGIKISEPAADLGIILSLASSFKNANIPFDCVVFGEVGLTGEVRAVNFAEKRITEAFKLGFKRCLIPYDNYSKDCKKSDIDIFPVKNIKDALETVLK